MLAPTSGNITGAKQVLRNLALELAHLARARRGRRLAVLLYHRILPSPDPQDVWAVTPSVFDRHLRILAEGGFADVPLEELEPRRVLTGRKVLIAFDDGYRSVIEHGLPLLQAARRQAAFFLVAGAIGGTSEWERPFRLTPAPIMRWEEARDLVAAGMAIGSHSFTHADLSVADDRTIADEVARSKAVLEERLRVDITTFSVPFGRDDGRIDPHLKAAGYARKLTNPLAVPRARIDAVGVTAVLGSDSIRTFRHRLSGADEVLLVYHRMRGMLSRRNA